MLEGIERFGNLVWWLSRRFTESSSEAEDAVREIFIELWSKAGRFDERRAGETAFVAMVARRRLIVRMRKSGRQSEMEEISDRQEAAAADVERDLSLRDEAARAKSLIGQFEPRQQQIMRLRVHEGHSHQSIADILDLPLGTVKTHLRRGLLQVRESMRSGRARGASEVGR